MKKRFFVFLFALVMASSLFSMAACSKNEVKISLNKVSIYMGETNEDLIRFNSVDQAFDHFNAVKTSSVYQKAVYWAKNSKLTLDTQNYLLHDEYRGVNYLLANTLDHYLKDYYQPSWTLHVFWGNAYIREDYAHIERNKNGVWQLIYEDCDLNSGCVVKVVKHSK